MLSIFQRRSDRTSQPNSSYNFVRLEPSQLLRPAAAWLRERDGSESAMAPGARFLFRKCACAVLRFGFMGRRPAGETFCRAHSTFAQFLENFCPVFRELLGTFWRTFGQFLEKCCPFFRELLGSFWRTFGQFSENFWAVFGELLPSF